jgi:hypothetical protein
MQELKLTRAFWLTSANVGDNLNHFLLSRLCADRLVFTPIESVHTKIVAIGSILNWCNESCIAWGPGLASQTDCVNPAMKIAAVRGPRSRKRAVECGLKVPKVYGDPALLLPMVYKPKPISGGRPALIPHYVDQDTVFHRYAPDAASETVTLIDVLDAPEAVIDQIAGASCVISSSLHGIIIAHAYGVPAAWVTFGGPIGGDGMKYHDHFEAVGLVAPGVVDVADLPDTATLIARCEPYFTLTPRIDTAPLLKAAPFPLRKTFIL